MKHPSFLLAFAISSVVASMAIADGAWMDGKVTYKFAGVATVFDNPADACKAGVAELAKSGNKKTFVSVVAD